MTTDEKIRKIFELQNRANQLHDEIRSALAEADELAKDLYERYGRHMISHGVPYRMEHKGIGFGICGNRWWIEHDASFRIVEPGE